MCGLMQATELSCLCLAKLEYWYKDGQGVYSNFGTNYDSLSILELEKGIPF